jgi:hypothetical protein
MYMFGTLIDGICLDDKYLAKSTPLVLLDLHILWYMMYWMICLSASFISGTAGLGGGSC